MEVYESSWSQRCSVDSPVLMAAQCLRQVRWQSCQRLQGEGWRGRVDVPVDGVEGCMGSKCVRDGIQTGGRGPVVML